MTPCTSCNNHGRTCVVLNEQSKRCGECVRRGYNCDVVGPSDGDWRALEREEERLAFETRLTREAVATAMAKLKRLELQRDLLKKRGAEMLRRGLQTLDELDAVEEEERKAKEKKEAEESQQAEAHRAFALQYNLGAAPEPIANGLADDWVASIPADDPFWATLGFDGGTPQPSQGS
jgi:hypothetical protein